MALVAGEGESCAAIESGAGMFGSTGAARRAAKVLWLCATARDTSGAPRMWLWAVDRLFGVTMNGERY
jgi:hypothetical protein